MRSEILGIGFWLLSWPAISFSADPVADIREIDPDLTTGSSKAVVVRDGPLAHTAQFLPFDKQGGIVGKDQAAIQTARVVKNLATALQEAKADLDHLAKLNVYAARQEVIPEIRRFLALGFRSRKKPAMTFVVGKLAHPDALVAMDAVAPVPGDSGPAVKNFQSVNLPDIGCTHVTVVPGGTKIYIAGQAEKGKTTAEAARLTLESLRNALQVLGCRQTDIVQLKAFLTPMTEVDGVRKEMAKFFGKIPVPPLVFVEWNSTLPIEIEVIARGETITTRNGVEYMTPPGRQPSPLFSWAARFQADQVIYVSGLYGEKAMNAEAEVQEIFTSLEDLLKQTGSDFRHLVKATYYHSADESVNLLNDFRKKHYDPRRPPAASKALVPGVGRADKTLSFDMIAVPKKNEEK